jgi:pimeloyl-ACP methyl ester carboxylesterase
MRRFDLRIDVSEVVALPGPLELALSVFTAEEVPRGQGVTVIAAFPGGGYGRGYFNMQFPGHEGYSEAEHHTSAALIFIAGDHLGVGDSSVPDLSRITVEMIAAASDHAIREILARLRTGSLAKEIPPLRIAATVGIGQSMGGCMTVIMQARHSTYDAIAPLGYSAIHTVLPQRTAEARRKALLAHRHGRGSDMSHASIAESSAQIEDFVYPFHWEDVPPDILNADMAGGYPLRRTVPPFGSRTIPTCALQMMAPGFIAAEAAAITVPVLVGVGERDVCPEPLEEARAYRRAQDVSIYIVPRMAHMHNFAGTRQLLWDRLVGWTRLVAART